MEHLDQYNILAIELIEYLGNDNPEQEQIDLIEYLISKAIDKQNYRLQNFS